MISERKIAANRRNAQHSTGPRTLSGKAISCMNALKHGLCSRKPLVPGEDPAEFERFATDLVDHFRPSDPVQCVQVEQYILSAWQLRRVPHIRAGLLTQQMHPQGLNPYAMEPAAYVTLSRIDRHQAALEKTMRQALERLEAGDWRPEEEQNEPTEAERLESEEVRAVPPASSLQPPASGGLQPPASGPSPNSPPRAA